MAEDKQNTASAPEGVEASLREILRDSRTIAVYGMSRNPEAPAQEVPLYLAAHGYRIIPINPHVEAIAGLKAYASLAEVPERIDLLNVFRPAPEVPAVVAQALERRAKRGDIDTIWLQRGIASAEGKALAEAAGVRVVQDRCLMVDHRRLIAGRAKG